VGTGRALCIGVDTSERGEALAESDARALLAHARRQGFESTVLLLGAAATRRRVRAHLHEAAQACREGDLFLLTFSGHGGARGTWVLADGTLDDDGMREALAEFQSGVRVLVISDSCNGGVPVEDPHAALPRISASVLVLAACRRDQYADAPGMPAHFTTVLLRAWQERGRALSHRAFYESIIAGMPAHQQPTYFRLGANDPLFEGQPPFTI
jgi:metacaspase-1